MGEVGSVVEMDLVVKEGRQIRGAGDGRVCKMCWRCVFAVEEFVVTVAAVSFVRIFLLVSITYKPKIIT